MAGLDGLTRTYRLSSSVRVAKFTALIADATDTTSTTGAVFAKIPTGSNSGRVVGVTLNHWVEPNQFYQEDTDPSTITGTTPASPYATLLGGTSNDIGPTVQHTGQVRCYAASGAVITAGQIVVIADVYGRVDSASHLAISGGTKIYPVGLAVTAASATNVVVLVELMFLPIAYVSGS
ncbi:MAG: hypothetical protein WBA09_22305 [Candidatus Acidiferrum sp.]